MSPVGSRFSSVLNCLDMVLKGVEESSQDPTGTQFIVCTHRHNAHCKKYIFKTWIQNDWNRKPTSLESLTNTTLTHPTPQRQYNHKTETLLKRANPLLSETLRHTHVTIVCMTNLTCVTACLNRTNYISHEFMHHIKNKHGTAWTVPDRIPFKSVK